MGTITKRGKRWRAQIMRAGQRHSKTFFSKSEAMAWLVQVEREPRTGAPEDKTVADLLDSYADKVSPTKRGAKWEKVRLAKIGRTDLGAVKVRNLSQADIVDWKDTRMGEVTAGSVLREMALLKSVMKYAIKELRWLSADPMDGMRRPESPEPRRRRLSDAEVEAILVACGYSATEPPLTVQARVGAALRLALATAMRAGELVNLRWTDITGRVARIRKGKTGARDVPLLPDALTVLEQLKPVTEKDGRVLAVSSEQLDALWRKARDRAMVEDLHFHDSRAEALTRLARKVDVLTLARISGHKDLRMLSEVYYRETAEEMAARLS